MDHWPLMERMVGVEIMPRRNIHSPIRDGDRTPSFGLYRSKSGQAKWRDFGSEGGDIYKLAMLLYRCDFREAIRKTAQLAGVLPGSPRRHLRPVKLSPRRQMPTGVRMEWEPRKWSVHDDHYWGGKYGRTENELARFNIRPAEVSRIMKEPVVEIRHRDECPMYVMEIGTAGHVKCYRPLAPHKYRYIGNTNMEDVFGEDLIEEGIPLVITAGQKDALNLHYETGVNAVALNAESIILTGARLASLANKCRADIFVMYDNDNAGTKAAERMVSEHPIIKRVRLSQVTDLKDFSDLVEQRDQASIHRIKTMLTDDRKDRGAP